MQVPQPPGRAYEHELVDTVSAASDRWLTELRLAVIGIIISVGIGAADIGLSAGGWAVALAAGVGSVVLLVALLWRLRPRARRRSEATDDGLRGVGRELADLRASLDANPNPLRELLDAFAAAAEVIAEHLDRIAEEAYISTESGETLRRVRAYDAELHELTAEIRCLRAKQA